MANEPKGPKGSDVCQAISHPSLQPGWGCCQCRTYNGEQRHVCKVCKHQRCDVNADTLPN